MTGAPNIQQLLQEGAEHHRRGDLPRAEQCYRAVLTQEPNHPDALHLLGMLADQVGRHEDAIRILTRAALVAPRDPVYLNTLGIALQRSGKLDDAAQAFERAMNLSPEFLEPAMRLGSLLKEQNKNLEALAVMERTVKTHPKSADARFLLAESIDRWGDRKWAIESYRAVVELNPNHAPAWYNLAHLLDAENLLDEATECYERVCALDEKLGDAKQRLSELRKTQLPAIEEPTPLSLDGFNLALPMEQIDLAEKLESQGRVHEAVHEYRKALELDVTSASLHSRLLVALNYLPAADPLAVYAEHVTWAAGHGAVPTMLHLEEPNAKKRKLRIGYVSPDFRDTPLSRFIEPLLTNQDRSKFEIVCYSNSRDEDDTTTRIRAQVDGFHNIRDEFDDRVARRIQSDQIDILVDLAGHLPGNRLGVFAYKPAPIQVTYLGYPNTTGLAQIDYRLTDPVIDPVKQKRAQQYAEPGISRAACMWCFSEPGDAPDVEPVPSESNGHATFGCFARLAMINEPLLDLWSQILQRLPDSHLLLKCGDLAEQQSRDRVAQQLTARGIAAERFLLRGSTPGYRDHLATYSEIDVALDTNPWNDAAATCEALYMGVPVITMCGALQASRIGASLLRALRLGDLVANSPDNYVEKAARLATNPRRLATLRSTLRQRMRNGRLMNGRKFAKEIERVYRAIWREHCKHTETPLQPPPIDLPSPPPELQL